MKARTSARTRTGKAANLKRVTPGGFLGQAALGLLLALALLLALVEVVGACLPLYRDALREAAQADTSALTETHFQAALRRTLDYTRGLVSDLQLYVPRTSPSEAEPAFSEREISHMTDVRALFAAAKRVRLAAVVVLVVALGATAYTIRGSRSGHMGDGREMVRARHFWGGVLIWSAVWGLAPAALVALLAAVNFRWTFDQFHYLFFSNDLWLLPVDSMLITMLPVWQFARLAGIIGGAYACLETAAALAGRRLMKVS